LAGRKPGTFSNGHDPRRNMHGSLSKAEWEARERLGRSLPKACEILEAELLDPDKCGDAARDILDRTLPKPKDNDAVADRMRVIFAKLRTILDERSYLTILDAIAEGEQHAALAGKEE
jgi:hypothetical protein